MAAASGHRGLARRPALVSALAVIALTSIAGPSGAAPYLRPSKTVLVTTGYDGRQATERGTTIGVSSPDLAVSASGRFIAFSSPATNIVAKDTNEAPDVFLRDRDRGTTVLVSAAHDGKPAVGTCGVAVGSGSPSITPDGRYVAFSSCAANLVPGDLNLAGDVFLRDVRAGTTELVSLSTSGKQGLAPPLSHGSSTPSISDDGRLVTFSSAASDLVPGDTNGISDIFVRDRKARTLRLVSLSSSGALATGGNGSGSASISGNGRFVAYTSSATNLVADDTNRNLDVFVRDLLKGTTERASVGHAGAQSTMTTASTNYSTGGRSITQDGRYVMFASGASNLVPNDTNGAGLTSAYDIFVRDRVKGLTERISVTSTGRQPSQGSTGGSISPDGRFVTYGSTANDLSPGDTGLNGSGTTTVGTQPGDQDVFLHDRRFLTTEMLSRAPDGTEAKGVCALVPTLSTSSGSSESAGPSVSADGQYVAFISCASNLVTPDTNNAQDVFLRRRGPHLGSGVVTASSGGTVTLKGWATFSGAVLAAASDPANDGQLDAALTGGELTRAELLYRPELDDLLLRVDLSSIPSAGVGLNGVSAPGDPRLVYALRFSANGQSYEVRVNRVGASTGNPLDAAYGLFSCTELVCNQVAELQGGYGSTGQQVVVAIPLEQLKEGGRLVREGAVLTGLRAFTAYGSFLSGGSQLLDQVLLTKAPSVKIPSRRVTVTIGRKTVTATLKAGVFSASFPRSALGSTSSTRAIIRTCLGTECSTSHLAVKA